ncbi:MAG: NAD(P)H-hydrate dehydratase, partial [Bryobacteraceae bacterium]
AGHRAVELLVEKFSPLSRHRIVILCGKGNNGGDGYVIARQLYTRFTPAALYVVAASPAQGTEPFRMLGACGCPTTNEITPEMRNATIVVDALLGTGIAGAAKGPVLEFIREINTGFPLANVVAVDIPSGMPSDSGISAGEVARADYTVTFTAPKVAHVMPSNCDHVGELVVRNIGSPGHLFDFAALHVTEPADFERLLRPRNADSNKGTYGHVLVAGGAPGKAGAAEMTGVAALRAGAGLVTVASSAASFRTLELMTNPLPQSYSELEKAFARMDVLAIGPGMGSDPHLVALMRQAACGIEKPVVIDADGLNALAGFDWNAGGRLRVLTPHPGEMSRLTGKSVREVQEDRLRAAREYAASHGCILVLKGHRTVIAFPDGRAWVNPVDSPGMATGGTGDILTGLIAGFLAQFPEEPEAGILAAVYLHGLAGILGARALGEKSLIATDVLTCLPEAIRECTLVSDRL